MKLRVAVRVGAWPAPGSGAERRVDQDNAPARTSVEVVPVVMRASAWLDDAAALAGSGSGRVQAMDGDGGMSPAIPDDGAVRQAIRAT